MKRILSLLCLLLVTALPSQGFASESITITEISQLDFSTLQRPSSGSQTIRIDPSSGNYYGTGTVISGTPTRGEYKIRRIGNDHDTSSCTIDIQNVGTGSGAVTIQRFRGVYDGTYIASFPESGLSKPSTGQGSTLYLGATASYTSSVPQTTLTPTFDIVVTLE